MPRLNSNRLPLVTDLHVACAAKKPVVRVLILLFLPGGKNPFALSTFPPSLTHVFELSFVIINVEM